MSVDQLQSQFERKQYVLEMGPENFVDYDFADEAQADVESMLDALSGMSEHHEPVMYANLLEDVVNSLSALEAHLA